MSRKIRVEFELDANDVKALIEAGAKGPTEITDADLTRLAKKGAIRASDYLNRAQIEEVSDLVLKLLPELHPELSRFNRLNKFKSEPMTKSSMYVAEKGPVAKRRPKK